MELPISLKNAIEEKAEAFPQPALMQSAARITARYRTESGQDKRLVSDEVDTVTYAVVRMPATFGAACSALRYTLAGTDAEIRTVLDIGTGTGTAAWAVFSELSTVEQMTCVEREPAMIRFASSLMQDTTFSEKIRWVEADMCAFKPTEQYDLVIASYSLNELSDARRAAVLQTLWAATGKVLLIVEPGTPEAFRQLKLTRTALLGSGAHLLAPCPHADACPLPAGDWCHFTCRVARSRLHKQLKGGDVPFEDEKYAYLAVSKTPGTPAESRVLRHPQIESGRITLQLCTKTGTEMRVVTKKNKDQFKAARKADAGDAFM
ncbi:MAG: methyltransferase domain-containing protein [Clostridia bacterium]|nr:methyltransferase domain-containing protein [Clostridia bacterium]